MADTDLERLVVTLEAQSVKLDNAIQASADLVDKKLAQIEARTESMRVTVESSFSKLGGAITTSLAAVGVGLTFEGLEGFVDKITDTAMNAKKQAAAIGISAQTFQAWSILAQKADVDQNVLNSTLERFAQNIGKAQLKITPFGQLMQKYLGPDALSGSIEDVIYRFSDFLAKVPSATQRAAVLGLAGGGSGGSRGGIAMAQFFGQGSASLKSQVQTLIGNGEVIPQATIDKITELDKAWIDLKATLAASGADVIAGFTTEFGKFAESVSAPAFQTSLKNFGIIMGDIVADLPTIVRYLPDIVAAFYGYKYGGPVGAVIGLGLGEGISKAVAAEAAANFTTPDEGNKYIAGLQKQRAADVQSASTFMGNLNAPGFDENNMVHGLDVEIAAAQKRLASLPKVPDAVKPPPPPTGNINLAGALNKPNNTAAEAARSIADLNKQIDGQISETVTKGETAYDDLVKAQNDAMLAQAKGTAAYYALNAQAIEQNAALDIQKIDDARDAELKAISDRQAAQLASIAAMKGLTPGEKATEDAKVIAAANHEEVNTTATAADQIGAINAKKNQALMQNDWQYQQKLQNQIQLNASLRDGLDNIAAAGVTGFKSMKTAAASLLDSIAQLIIKLYIMQPLLDSLLGPTGTTGGGAIGGLLGSIFGSASSASFTAVGADPVIASLDGFANGGVFVPGQGSRALKRFAGGGTSSTAAIFGEAGIEAAVPLPDGRSIPVSLKMPNIPQISGGRASSGPVVIQNFDLSGAVMTQDLYDSMNSTAASHANAAVAQYDKMVLPTRVAKLNKNPRLR